MISELKDLKIFQFFRNHSFRTCWIILILEILLFLSMKFSLLFKIHVSLFRTSLLWSKNDHTTFNSCFISKVQIKFILENFYKTFYRIGTSNSKNVTWLRFILSKMEINRDCYTKLFKSRVIIVTSVVSHCSHIGWTQLNQTYEENFLKQFTSTTTKAEFEIMCFT